MAPYKALDVAGYVVSYCNSTGKKISHLQLQKILYFLEANYLVNGKQLFEDDISKWRLGPVVESVYHEYKTFGSQNIGYVPKRLGIDSDGKISIISYNPDAIDPKDKEIINEIVDKYIKYDPFQLVKATHRHAPWKRDEQLINKGVSLLYDKEELKEFFINNPDAFEVQ